MPAIKVIGISSSPRRDGNTEILLREALAAARASGAGVEYVALREKRIAPCVECNHCYRTGVCRVEDDFQQVFRGMIETDRLVFATPVFFMTVCAHAKAMIDRCQCLWSRKYVLKQPLFPTGGRDRRALVIAVGGSRSRKMFDCVRLTMKYYLDVLDMKCAANLFVNRADERGAVLRHPSAMAEAARLGRELADPDIPPPAETSEVELYSE
ncbi:MAG: flavodoxin family protein [Planctomycetota bacterium]|nr:flavodoxin family protein [Planctomycetota bacterium]